MSAFDVEYIVKDICQFFSSEGSVRVKLPSLAERQKFFYVLALENVLLESCQVIAVYSEAGCIKVFSDFVKLVGSEIILELFACCFREEMPPVNDYFIWADVYCRVFVTFRREDTSYRFIDCLRLLALFSRCCNCICYCNCCRCCCCM